MKPLIEQRADPYIFQKDGCYFFTASVPVMVTEEKNGLYGPGHNSFTKDEAAVLVYAEGGK